MRSKTDTSRILIIVLCLVIIIAFFLPWISIQRPGIKGPGFITRGFRISLIKQSPDASFLFGVGEKFDLQRDYIETNGKIVWVYPILAVIIAFLAYFSGRSKPVIFLITTSSFCVFLIGLYKVTAANLEKINLELEITYGLWITLCACLGIAILGSLMLSGNNLEKEK